MNSLASGQAGWQSVPVLKLYAFEEVPQNLVLALAVVLVTGLAKKCAQLVFTHAEISPLDQRQHFIGLQVERNL